MLILSRKVGEILVINDNIHVIVLSVASNQVKVGVVAPRNVNVHRAEAKKKI